MNTATRRIRIAILGAGAAGLSALKEARRYTDRLVSLGQAFAQRGCEMHASTRSGTIAGLRDPAINASLLAAPRRQMAITTGATINVRPSDDGAVLDDGSIQ